MKQLQFILIFLFLGLFFYCKPTPGDEENGYGHFHSCAQKNANGQNGFSATLKVPDYITDKKVYLSEINFMDKETTAPKGTPHAGRREILLAGLTFSTNSAMELEKVKTDAYTWNKECKTIIFKSNKHSKLINEIGIASIQIKPISGIDTIKFDDRVKQDHTDPCLKFFKDCEPNHEANHVGGFVLFMHDGHEIGDPRSGFEGITIKP